VSILLPSLPLPTFLFSGTTPWSQLEGLGEHCELSRGSGQISAAKQFWFILRWKIGLGWVVTAMLKRFTEQTTSTIYECTKNWKVSLKFCGCRTPTTSILSVSDPLGDSVAQWLVSLHVVREVVSSKFPCAPVAQWGVTVWAANNCDSYHVPVVVLGRVFTHRGGA